MPYTQYACVGDVRFQDTLTQELISEAWVCPVAGHHPVAGKRRHHRLVSGVVGYSLSRLRGTRELLHATYDVYTGMSWPLSLHLDPLFTADLWRAAMQDALEKDSRIHRDISVGNIVLVKEKGSAIRRGYLIDWETSCKVDDDGAATEVGRVVSISACCLVLFLS